MQNLGAFFARKNVPKMTCHNQKISFRKCNLFSVYEKNFLLLDVKFLKPCCYEKDVFNIVFVDGEENASQRFSSEKIKKMISFEKEKYGWEFIVVFPKQFQK